MHEAEAKKLKLGDRVKFQGRLFFGSHLGTVTANDHTGFTVKWDDGLEGGYLHNQATAIQRSY